MADRLFFKLKESRTKPKDCIYNQIRRLTVIKICLKYLSTLQILVSWENINTYFLNIPYKDTARVMFCWINVGEYRSGNQKRTIQRNWKQRVYKTTKNTEKLETKGIQDDEKQNKDPTQYVLDTKLYENKHK